MKDVGIWLNYTNEKVRKFAKNYIVLLADWAKSERLRAEEEIELRKYHYRDNETTSKS